MANLQIRA